MNKAKLSRRGFVLGGIAAGVAIRVNFLADGARADVIDNPRDARPAWIGPNGKPRFRMDAVAKVTGDKTFTRDFRAKDMPGWPTAQSNALFIRANRADAAFESLDLSVLGADLQPDRLVLGEELVRDGLMPPDGAVVVAPGFYGDRFLVLKGETPRLLGQPVALLIYHDFPQFAAARRKLRFADVIQWGAKTGYHPPPPYGAGRSIRVGGATPADADLYAPLTGTIVGGTFDAQGVVWPAANASGNAAEKAMAAAETIAAGIENAGPDALVLQRRFYSQSVDASAMEPDNGLVWYQADSGRLHAMIATQSPYEVATATTAMVAISKFKLTAIDLSIGYTVGYGTKDHSIFPYYCMIAGLYGDGRPVRLANDRFEQFQMGLKRHAFWIDNTLVIDRKTQSFEAMKGVFRCDGGGRRNFSPEVGFVGMVAAQGIYYLPRSDFSYEAVASRAVDAGSTRGFGTLQTMSATEIMVDEAAEILGVDAIALRLKNVLRTGMKNSQGAIAGGQLRDDELLVQMQTHPLWTGRAERKAVYEAANPGKRYGIGFAQVHKDFGSVAEGAITTLTLDPTGLLSMRQHGNDMGTGMTTSQAMIVAAVLGRAPESYTFGIVDWPEMPLSDEGTVGTQADQDALAQNPRWTPCFLTSMSSSNSAFFIGHATREAARALLRFSLWPAAVAIWSEGAGGGQFGPLSANADEIRFEDGHLTAGGLEPLSYARLAKVAHERGLITGVSVHSFNRWQFSQAIFDVPTIGTMRLPIDALSLRFGDGAGGFRFIDRQQVFYPEVARMNAGVTYYSGMATLVELAVDTASGQVDLLSHHSLLECGNQIVPELVSGQIQGGLAMGIGHALHEDLPLYEDGPGNGTWNWNRYRLPHGRDVAVWTQTTTVLPPLSETDPPKGMAEVVMIAVVPAIANAVTHAIGKRFYATPITPEQILEALS
ncbi:xanthine dehydrogenase family protein molybdopterin-binding subunit [Acidisoma cellulosilytica]|uniref:Xanthine dehydrogenase family protein molybdopterin-binding subunit n=1 Tax=Acidisoma cellulosilyticum TaxID=2802395 RepID=A0A964E496_9PROT|nr:molybdopterin cofactor-binding domain-containing protein [Acidisoma cellulosilyticum]MCB8881249.1 xanthine dehydrogenase family protein molybdopterin-binding subunit [Acidisoma cellulosilyticum]